MSTLRNARINWIDTGSQRSYVIFKSSVEVRVSIWKLSWSFKLWNWKFFRLLNRGLLFLTCRLQLRWALSKTDLIMSIALVGKKSGRNSTGPPFNNPKNYLYHKDNSKNIGPWHWGKSLEIISGRDEQIRLARVKSAEATTTLISIGVCKSKWHGTATRGCQHQIPSQRRVKAIPTQDNAGLLDIKNKVLLHTIIATWSERISRKQKVLLQLQIMYYSMITCLFLNVSNL